MTVTIKANLESQSSTSTADGVLEEELEDELEEELEEELELEEEEGCLRRRSDRLRIDMSWSCTTS